MKNRNLQNKFIRTKFAFYCQCGRYCPKGEMVYYMPLKKKALCLKCGDAEEVFLKRHQKV
jgi:hypothetical protein